MRKFWYTKLLFIFLVCFLVQSSQGKEDHYCHNDTITFEMAIQESTFWAGANPDSLKIYWGTYSGTGAPVLKDSLVLGSGNWTNWRIDAGDADAGYFVYKINASVDGTDSAYSCWAAAYALKGGVDGNKTWTWFVGACKEDTILAKTDTVIAKQDTTLAEIDSLFMPDDVLWPLIRKGWTIVTFDDSADFTYGGTGDYYAAAHLGGLAKYGNAIEVICTDTDSSYAVVDTTGFWKGGFFYRDFETISLWVYVNQEAGSISPKGDDKDFEYIKITLMNEFSGASTKFLEYDIPDSNLCYGWQHLVFHKDQLEETGSWTGGDVVRRISVTIKGEDVADSTGVLFDHLCIREKSTPVILLTYDDGDSSIYSRFTYAYNDAGVYATEGVKIKANVFLQGNLPAPNTECNSGNGNMCWEEIQALEDSGWAVLNHTYAHPSLNGGIGAKIRDEVHLWYSTIEDSLDFERDGLRFFAYPNGDYDAYTMHVLRDLGFWMARAAYNKSSSDQGHPDWFGGDELLNLRSAYLHTSAEDSATIKAKIDTTIMRGGLLILMFHSFRDSRAGHAFFHSEGDSVIQHLAEKVAAGECEVLTFPEYANKLRSSMKYLMRDREYLTNLSSYMGGCRNCKVRLFPEDGTASKDSFWIVDPLRGADSIIVRGHFIMLPDSSYYDASRGIFTKPNPKIGRD